jgi:hypothetical protein
MERRAEDPMSEGQETGISITGCLCEIRDPLTDAAAVAKAAVTCAESGSEHQAVRIVLDVEEMLHEVSTLLNGITLLRRIERGGGRERNSEPD